MQQLYWDTASEPAVTLSFVEEINHRVVNEFAEAIASLSLAAKGTSCQHSRAVLDETIATLFAHSELHRALLRPPVEARVNLADYLTRICAAFSKASLAARGVRVHVDADDIFLERDRCWRMGLIVAELVRNAARHGLRGGSGMILVRAEQQLGQVACVVGDNGRANANPVPGRGQEVVRDLARDLLGEVNWQFTENGSAVCLRVPVDAWHHDANSRLDVIG